MMPTITGKYKIYTGKVEEICTGWKASHFDACLCDPPYLLQFMGKEFDKQHKKEKGQNEGQKMQAWHERWTREVLRVMKPGAHMLAFGGTRTYHRLVSAAEDVGFEVRDMLTWLHGQGFPKNKDTQLKPAVEPCVLARKPGSVGKLNIDGCRLTANGIPRTTHKEGNKVTCISSGVMLGGKKPHDATPPPSGRWPANLILDEVSAVMLDEQSGITKSSASGYNREPSSNANPTNIVNNIRSGAHFGDSGGASRFFYTSKVSTRERNLGGIDCRHPTLKPISLTTYLSRLLLPPPSSTPRRILVPFSGAGSEIVGALLAGWDQVIGIEMDTEYISWSRDRIKAARNGEFKL